MSEAGLDVVSISKDSPGISDKEVMARARKEGRVILTFDSDYGELIYREQMPVPAGVLYFRFTPEYPDELGEFLLKLLENNEVQLEQRFTVASRDRIRQRRL